MESQNKQESIFEQEDYDGGFGSGPLASAPDTDDRQTDDEDGDETEEMDIDA